MNTSLKRTFLALCIFIGLSMSTSVLAIDYKPLTTIPGVSAKGIPLETPKNLVLGIYTASIGIASILAVIMIVIGGIKYTVMESFDVKTDAKKQITAAFLGLVLLLGSYLILRTINKDLVEFNTTLPATSGGQLALLGEERAKIVENINTLKRNYDAANAKVAGAQREATALQTQKNALEAEYNKIPASERNSQRAKDLEAQITELNTKYTQKTEEVSKLSNEANNLRLDGLVLINTDQVLLELSKGNVDMANHAVQRLANIEQQKIDQLKKQNAPQEEIKKAEANKTYVVAVQVSTVNTTQALREIATQAGVTDQSKIRDIKLQIMSDANKAIALISPVDNVKAEELRKEALANVKKIDDALAKLNQSLPCLNRDNVGC
jgi:hypothetical protein